MPSGELVQSLTRGLSILEAVSASEDGLTVAQIAEALGLKRPTAHNLSRTLAAGGFLVAVSEPARYRLGPALGQLLAQHNDRAHLRAAQHALRAGWRRAPDASWVFVEAGGPELRVTLRVEGQGGAGGVAKAGPDGGVRVQKPVRDVLHPYDSATALCLHAFASQRQREEHQSRYPFDAYHGLLWESLDQFNAFAAAAREKGYAQPPDGREGSFRISAPVFNHAGELQAMVGLHLPKASSRTDRKRCIAALVEQARLLTQTHMMETPA